MNAKRYKTFDEMQLTFVNHIRDAANMARLGIAAATAEQLVLFYNQWTAIYYQYIDPLRRTRAVTAEIYRIYIAYGKLIRAVRQQIKFHNRDKLTADDRVNLSIKLRGAYHFVAAPAEAVLLIAYQHQPRITSLRVELPDGKSRMPKNHHLRLEYAIVAPGAVAAAADFYHFKESTRLKFPLEFGESDRGKVCFIRGCLVTRRGLTGPMSDTIDFNIL